MFVHIGHIKENVNKLPKMCDGLSIPARQIITKQLSKLDDDLESMIQDIGYLVLVEIDAQVGIDYKDGKYVAQ